MKLRFAIEYDKAVILMRVGVQLVFTAFGIDLDLNPQMVAHRQRFFCVSGIQHLGAE